jgi:hypothetical protein
MADATSFPTVPGTEYLVVTDIVRSHNVTFLRTTGRCTVVYSNYETTVEYVVQ